MSSEIRTNSITSRAGLSTVTLTDTGPMFSGITTFVDNSAFSVGTGGTIHAPATNVMALGTNNIDAIKIDSSGNVNVTGILTASSISGGVSLANGSNDRVVTATGAAALNGEANMTFDGSLLKIASRAVVGNGSEYQIPSRSNTSSYTPQFQITGAWNNPTHGGTLALNGRSDYPILWLNSGASYQNNSGAGVITWSIKDGAGNYCNTAEIRSFVDGTPGNNDSPGDLSFRTTPSGTCQPTEAFRITSAGNHIISNSIGVNVPLPQITKGIQISKGGGSGGVSNTYSVANQYLHLGSAEYNTSGGLFSIGFGYINSGGSTAQYAPAYLGFKETSTSNHTRGDLVFATRSGTSVAEPTERLRIKHDGAIDIPSTSRITGSIVINAATPQLTNGLQVSKGGGSGGSPTSVSVANEHLHLGAAEYATNGLYMMGFGYVSGCTHSPAYIGLKTNSTSSCTRGDLIFATRSSTSGAAAPAERLRITSSGVLGINETNPQRYLHITGNDGTTGATSGNSDTQLVIENAGTNGAMIEFLSSNNGAGRIMFTDSDASNRGKIQYFHSSDFLQIEVATASQSMMALHVTKQNAASNVQSDMIAFDVGGSGRGKIVSAPNGSSSPQFSSYSDRRLKTNFRDYTGGYDRIKSIPVKLYDEVLNDQTKSIFGDNVKTDVIGWIADEVQSVFPESVRGTKDEVDSDGKPVYQSLTEGVFFPDAIQAIQKLIQKVETLEQENIALRVRVTNLEGN